MSTARRILARLNAVRQLGEQRWMARCPAHQDRTPSLSVTEIDDKVLIFCHGGCNTEAVLAAMGMTFRDLFPGDPWQASYEAACCLPMATPRFDPIDHERAVLEIARGQVAAGGKLTLEDQARLWLAIERLEEWGADK